MNYILKKSKTIYKGKVFNVQIDEIEYESGNSSLREIAVHPGGAVIVALTKDYKILFVNQFRYPLQQYLLELPAGKLESNEDPLTCAIRELEEETGYKTNNIKQLGSICTTPGFSTEILHIFLATDLEDGQHNREEGEQGMEVYSFSLKEIDEKIKSGEIMDGKTLSGIYLARLFLTSEKN